MISGIYLIINTENGKIYIGSAADIIKRWDWHTRALSKGSHHNILLQRAYDKYGDVFHFCIVEQCSVDNLYKIEQIWIDNCSPDYNIYKIAGSPRGRSHTEETKRKIGDWGRGRPLSEETKKKMSESQSNRSWSHHLNQAAAMKKRGITPEHKQKLKEANMKRGYKFND